MGKFSKVFLGFFVISSIASASHLLKCKESCQYWDVIENQCNYSTRCEVASDVASFYSCERWDQFTQQCSYEAKQVVPFRPDPFAAAPSCVEQCQAWDDFTNQCLYRTACEYVGKLLIFKSCDKWDGFAQKCSYESEEYRVVVY